MTRYRVHLEESAKKALRAIDEGSKRRIGKAIDNLESNPYPPGMKRLVGLAGLFRIRVGDYRIVYAVKNAQLVVLVVTIGHRREVYRGL